MRLEVKIGVDRLDAPQIVETPDDTGRPIVDAAVSSLVIERVPRPKRIRPEMSERIGGDFGDRLFRCIGIPRHIAQRDMMGMVDHGAVLGTWSAVNLGQHALA